MAEDKAKIWGIIAVKGGVGKTTLVANLGCALASTFKKSVLVVDSNVTAPNLGLHLGLINPKITLQDVLEGKEDVYKAVHLHDSGVQVIPASLHAHQVDPTLLREKLDEVREDFDYILVDSAPGLDLELVGAIEASDEVIIISSLDFPTISTTLKAIKLSEELKVSIRGVILNRVRGEDYELTLPFVEDTLKTPIIGVVPEDEAVLKSISAKTPVVFYMPASPASLAIRKIAATLIGEEYSISLAQTLWQRLKIALKLQPKPVLSLEDLKRK